MMVDLKEIMSFTKYVSLMQGVQVPSAINNFH
jgi:hypothetical protein